MILSRAIVALFALGSMTSCRDASAPAPPAGPLVAAAPPATTSSQSSIETATKLDKRTPVPLLPMMAEHQKEQMRGHLAAVQAIMAALAKDDFAAVSEATKKIGYSEPMAQMCSHMGVGASGFTPLALNFHRTADTIGEAAQKKDRAAVITALSATLSTCVGCHATYKQQIVDDATWTKLTAMAPPMGNHAMQQQ